MVEGNNDGSMVVLMVLMVVMVLLSIREQRYGKRAEMMRCLFSLLPVSLYLVSS